MTDKQELYQEEIDKFLRMHFLGAKPANTQTEHGRINEILNYVQTRFASMKYILGLAIDFIIVAERLSHVDSSAIPPRKNLTETELLARYRLVTKRGNTTANTLTLVYESGSDEYQEGIRKIEEQVVQLFHMLDRTGYPSAYVYNTGQWHKYRDLLVMCFSLSRAARFAAVKQLLEYGMQQLPENSTFGREKPRLRIFERIVEEYERRSKKENGGLVFQALAYGFFAADRPGLQIIADKVRTGSSRQKRIGDIDCYFGLDLEASIEVKDFEIDENNLKKELGKFMIEVPARGVLGIAFVSSVSKKASASLAAASVATLTEKDLLTIISYWDWQKQDIAVHGMLHYLSHIEQNPEAVDRLLTFIREIDPAHSSLAYLK